MTVTSRVAEAAHQLLPTRVRFTVYKALGRDDTWDHRGRCLAERRPRHRYEIRFPGRWD